MHRLILAAVSPDNTPHGYNWTFAFPMLLFIVIAGVLYLLFSRPHRRIPATPITRAAGNAHAVAPAADTRAPATGTPATGTATTTTAATGTPTTGTATSGPADSEPAESEGEHGSHGEQGAPDGTGEDAE